MRKSLNTDMRGKSGEEYDRTFERYKSQLLKGIQYGKFKQVTSFKWLSEK